MRRPPARHGMCLAHLPGNAPGRHQSVEFIQPGSWAEALAIQAELPAAVPLAGGTDLMVELNFGARRPPALLDLTRISELRHWDIEGNQVRLGAGNTYRQVITD